MTAAKAVTAIFSIEEEKPCECDLNNDGACNGSDWLLFYPGWGRTDCQIQ